MFSTTPSLLRIGFCVALRVVAVAVKVGDRSGQLCPNKGHSKGTPLAQCEQRCTPTSISSRARWPSGLRRQTKVSTVSVQHWCILHHLVFRGVGSNPTLVTTFFSFSALGVSCDPLAHTHTVPLAVGILHLVCCLRSSAFVANTNIITELQQEDATAMYRGRTQLNGSNCVDDLLTACLALHQVLKGSFNVIQSTIKFLNHVRLETADD